MLAALAMPDAALSVVPKPIAITPASMTATPMLRIRPITHLLNDCSCCEDVTAAKIERRGKCGQSVIPYLWGGNSRGRARGNP